MEISNKEIEKARELLVKFSKQTGIDFNIRTRTRSHVIIKTLFYKLLLEKTEMKDVQIAAFMTLESGVYTSRSTVYHSLRRVDDYYNDFEFFRDYHDIYFKNNQISDDEVEFKIKHITDNKDKKAIYNLLDTLDEKKLENVREMVELRVKSFAWKSIDKTEIITCEV